MPTVNNCPSPLADKFEQQVETKAFLSSYFKTTKRFVFKTGDKIITPFRLGKNKIAVAVTKWSGPNFNEYHKSEVMEVDLANYSEAFPVTAQMLENVPFGMTQFDAAQQEAYLRLADYIQEYVTDAEQMIRGALELQASQIFQTGKLDLADKDGNTIYTYTFPTPQSHFPTVGTTWDKTTAKPLDDLQALAKVIVSNGKVTVKDVVMNSTTFNLFINNKQVQEFGDFRRIVTVDINSTEMNQLGVALQGTVGIAGFNFNLWVYDEEFENPQTELMERYLKDNKVLMLPDVNSPNVRLEHYFISTPLIRGADTVAAGVKAMAPASLPFDNGPCLERNLYQTPDGRSLTLEYSGKNILIPTSFMVFGCLTVK